mgnify:CR=1 FL=1
MKRLGPVVNGICKHRWAAPNGKMVPCGRCLDCRYSYRNDLVGRCCAEMDTSDGVMCLTLTYSDDYPERAAMLTPRDITLWLKRLRKAGVRDGFTVRYLGAGEFGPAKGRCHWHFNLFFKGNVPEIPYDTPKFIWEFWPYGFTYATRPDVKTLAYAAKYVQKSSSKSLQVTCARYSKRPGLGHDFFAELADRYAKEGLSPQTFLYSVPGVRLADGSARKFLLRGKSREHFIDRYLETWGNLYPGRETPASELMEKYYDARIAAEPVRLWEKAVSELTRKAFAQNPFFDPSVYKSRSVRIKWTAQRGLVIAKDTLGRWFLRSYDFQGSLAMERELLTRSDMRLALLDQLPLFPVRR